MILLRNMIARFSRRDRLAAQIYADCVAVARAPNHYRDGNVPDSVDGRFDMLALHLFVLVHRLKSAGPSGEALVQSLIDCFVRDMDHNLREMGAGDVGVARNIKQMAQALNGLLHGYERALSAGPDGLRERVLRNVLAVTSDETGQMAATPAQIAVAERLTAYVQAQLGHLALLSDQDCAAGRCQLQPVADAYGEGTGLRYHAR